MNSHGITCEWETILAWEHASGETSREPSASDLAIIALAFGCSVGELFVGREPATAYLISESEGRSDSRR